MKAVRYALAGLILISLVAVISQPLTCGTGSLSINKGCGATYYPGEVLLIYYKVSAPASTNIKATLQVELPDGTTNTFFTDKTLLPNVQYVAPGLIGSQLGTRTVKLIWKEPPLLILYTQTCTYTVSSGGGPSGTTLRIESNVSNFQVYWNGVYHHTTSLNYTILYSVPAGTHTVTLKKAGCTDASKSVTIIPGTANTVTINMDCGPGGGEVEVPDIDGDGVPDDEDRCYNPDCNIVDNRGCPKDTDRDGVNECDDRCPTEAGLPDNQGCPAGDRDNDGVTDDEDGCYNPNCSIVDSHGCPLDSDGDGLNDCDDECPAEYGERRNRGCPVEDTDGDGVPDDQDQCYNPNCTLVDSRGCPWDSDNDGLNDCEDQCPNQAGPSNNYGCPEPEPELPFCLGTAFLAILVMTGAIFSSIRQE
jgi:hypothetical protein